MMATVVGVADGFAGEGTVTVVVMVITAMAVVTVEIRAVTGDGVTMVEVMVMMVLVTILVTVAVVKGMLGVRALTQTMVTTLWIVTVSVTAVEVAMVPLGCRGRKEGQVLAPPGPWEARTEPSSVSLNTCGLLPLLLPGAVLHYLVSKGEERPR